MRILFDADSMVYGCGFAAQKTIYDWVASDGDECVEGVSGSREELAAAEAMLPEGWRMEAVVALAEAEPVENALALVKRQIFRISQKLDNDGYIYSAMELYITGKGNHRDEIAKVRPYKGNRVHMEKPVHYAAIRRYLVNRWDAAVVNGWEADDEVATEAASCDYDPGRVMIVSQDKDLRTVPGLLLNYRHNQYELINERQALANFYRQMVTGDVTDNVVGCYKSGEKVAERIVNEHMTPRQMYEAVLKEYEASLGRKGCPYADRTAEDVALEMGRLLHLSRFKGDIWSPPPKEVA